MTIVPRSRPQTTRDGVLSFITDGLPLPPLPFLVGRRGYYADSMGRPGANDLGIFDDAIFLVEQDQLIAWNANCDPSRQRVGMATLVVGRWIWKPGIHNQSKDPALHPHYEALVQAAPFVVRREGTEAYAVGTRHPQFGQCVGPCEWRGLFGINGHRGGETTTSSEGCQTIPPTQWPEVMPAIHRALHRVGRDVEGRNELTYVLTSRY